MLNVTLDPLSQRLDGSKPAAALSLPPEERCHSAPAVQRSAARSCRSIGETLNASAFSLLFWSPAGESRKLIPLLDDCLPSKSPLSRALSTSSQTASLSVPPTPSWWRPKEEPAFLTASARQWAQEVEPPVDNTSGIAFPVAIERCRSGVVVFVGDDMLIDEAALCETHARCHALFDAVAREKNSQDLPLPAISRRELECLRLTAKGLTSEEIAAALGLSVHTANQYLTNTTHKLNAVNRIQAVAKALRSGLID